jgi:O-acetyl-ADP-ribose deacetylase (regulator of RNase III)
LVNAANSSFFPKGSGINRAVHEAAPELNKLTKALYKSAETGKAYPVGKYSIQ